MIDAKVRHVISVSGGKDSDVDTVLGEPRACVLRKDDGDEA